MNSFKKTKDQLKLPVSAVWLMNAISEYKGKQELYSRQSPQLLKRLVEMAIIQSVESSNRIEGVTVDDKRLRPLVLGKAKPQDRSEEEVAGYRNALNWIHKKYDTIDISPQTIQQLHRYCMADSGDAGQWKRKDNEIIRKTSAGEVEVIYRPLSAALTPKAVERLCLAYRHGIEQEKLPPLYAVACLILDFLCIHPFRDGNGRVSRLLTLLALYQRGFDVGRYISLERIVEQSKETYYESLNTSSQQWLKGSHDITHWLNYFLGMVHSAYRELQQRAGDVKSPRGSKTEMVLETIFAQQENFSISDIERLCPFVGRDMVRLILRRLQKEKKLVCVGKGKNARWKRMG
jgi:Fic family protein